MNGIVQKNATWPRYQKICGEVKRILGPGAVPEQWDGKQWAGEKLQG
jgi:hypothetical protein